MHSPAKPERFHALDATRAFALLLGVVFHAAWSFCPAPFGAPIVDVAASEGFFWFFFTSHTFRMQAFFLIAGFFGRLLYHRRGFAGFARHRLLRVGVPLVVGWFVLLPPLLSAWVAGGNVSGRNLVELPLPLLFTLLFKEGLIFVPRPLGGMFTLAHLWFLYYLLWFYALALGIRFILTRSETVAGRARVWADRAVAWVVSGPLVLVWLTVGTGLFLWPMEGWFGVDTPTGSLVPSVPVLLFYGFFFGLGWVVHRQAGLLRDLGRGWRWQLALGLALSIPMFIAFQAVRTQGAAVSSSAPYPGLEANQFKDWPGFLARLQSANKPEGGTPIELANLWRQLPPNAHAAILRLSDTSGPDSRAGVAEAINKLLLRPGLFGPELTPAGPRLSAAEAFRIRLENRKTLERLFPGSLASDPHALGWYRPVKLAYSMGYALVMWLFVFGMLGCFQACCPSHSPAWRYVADSSYWVYLIHLPLVPGLQIWMASWPGPGVVKFILLNLIAFAVLFASYHYLVRSTFIGWVLNGQRHPFAAWPFSKAAGTREGARGEESTRREAARPAAFARE